LDRAEEIRRLNRLSMSELTRRAGGRLTIVDNLEALHTHFARSIADILRDDVDGIERGLILPFGPVGQYPILSGMINRERISLRGWRFFFMDEYADASGKAVQPPHVLSFRGGMQSFWKAIEPDLRPLPADVIFPNENNISRIPAMIEECGGIHTCFGGVGIHGHVAFNEPESGVRTSACRLVRLNEYTITMNAIRASVGGDLENFPHQAYTLGMRECLAARHIRLYCRCDAALDWARTVLRLAVLGQPDDDYPVTWVREHPDWYVVTDRPTAEPPRYLL
jgi:glucosamine-6-phosphate deaminase